MIAINRKLLIPKLHYFLAFGSMAGTLPFLMTMATQLGCSPAMVGLIYSTMPFVIMVAKPCFGTLADKLQQKKAIFLSCIALMVASLFALYFLPRIGDEGGSDIASTTTTTSLVCHAEGSSLSVCGESPGGTDTHATNLEDINRRLTATSALVSSPDVIACRVTCSMANSTQPVFQSLCFDDEFCEPNGELQRTTLNNSTRSLSFSTTVNASRQVKDGGCYWLPLSGYEINGVHRGNPPCLLADSVLSPCHFRCYGGQFGDESVNVTGLHDEVGGGHHFQVTDIDGSTFQVNHQIVFLWLCMAFAWMGMGVLVSMGDTIVLDLMEDKSTFGRQRLWGAVGWGSVSVATGFMVDVASRGLFASRGLLDFTPCFFVTLALGALDIAFTSRIRVDRVERPRHILLHVAKLFGNPSVCLFALSVLFVGCLTGVLWTFLIMYMNELGASQILVGLTMAVQCFCGEIPFFFVSGWFLKKIGHAHSMTLVLFIFGIRLVLYSYVNDPWLVLPVELTQGITYGIFFTALATYPSLIAPANTQATVQGIFQGIFEGFGVGIGCFVGGILYQSIGGKLLFFYAGWTSCGMAALVGLLQFWLGRKYATSSPIPARDAVEGEKQDEMVKMCSSENPTIA